MTACGCAGISVAGLNHVIEGNEVKKGLTDGIEINGGINVTLAGNECIGNAHEGIENSGLNTLIRNNRCFKNGGKLGPDLAGNGTGAGYAARGVDRERVRYRRPRGDVETRALTRPRPSPAPGDSLTRVFQPERRLPCSAD